MCIDRSIVAQLDPLSSPLMRWYEKLPSQNHQKPEHPTIDSIDLNFFSDGASNQFKQKYIVCLLIWYSCKHCTKSQSNRTSSRCPMGKVSLKALEATRSVLLPKLSGLVMVLWRYCSWRSFRPYRCAYIFPANVDKSWIESVEVVRVLTQSTCDNRNHHRFDVVI